MTTVEIKSYIDHDNRPYIVPHNLDIFDGNYKVSCSNAYFELVRKSVISYVELGHLINTFPVWSNTISPTFKSSMFIYPLGVSTPVPSFNKYA